MRAPATIMLWMRIAWALGAAAAALVLLASIAWMVVRDPEPGLEGSLPAVCGAEGGDFAIRCEEGIPYLVSFGLPYPTGFDSTDHPRQSLDGTWEMRFDPRETGLREGWQRGGWKESSPVRVPSTYNAPGGPHRGHQGVVWFARRFRPGAVPEGRWSRLAFQGVLLRSRVWLNGIPLGDREGGYTPFFFDVTKALLPGRENLLVVRADNRLTYSSLPPRVRPAHNPVWGVYGGIFREVRLESLPGQYLSKLAFRPFRDASGAGFEADALVHGRIAAPPCSLVLSLTDPSGRPAGEARRALAPEAGMAGARFRFPLDHPMAWKPGDPKHYTLKAELRGETGTEAVWVEGGHRILATTSEGLLMDGRPLFLKGISKMEDHPESGQSQTPALIGDDLRLAKEMGANFLRLAHYPHHPAEIRTARDLGLMVGEEIPYFHVGAGWSQWLVDFQGLGGFPAGTFGLKHLHDRKLLLNAQRSLVELLERDGNNPAVILWSLGNESYSLNDRAGRVYGWLRQVALGFDATRPVSMAEMTYYLPVLDARRASARHLDIASLNMYFGWYFGRAEGAASHLDAFRARHPEKPVLLSEFGAEAALGRTDNHPKRTGDRVFWARSYSEGYQADLLAFHVRAAWERPYVIGVAPWCFADFYCPWFPHNPVPEYNNKGVMTKERVPKQGYFALQALYRRLPDFRDSLPGFGDSSIAGRP